MSNVAQTIAVIGGLGGLFGLIVGIQTFWISRALGRVEDALKETRDEVSEVKVVFLRDHGERIARLEERITR